MDIEPKLSPRQQYAIERISDIINNHKTSQLPKKPNCCYKMTFSATAMLAIFIITPPELQQHLHFMHQLQPSHHNIAHPAPPQPPYYPPIETPEKTVL